MRAERFADWHMDMETPHRPRWYEMSFIARGPAAYAAHVPSSSRAAACDNSGGGGGLRDVARVARSNALHEANRAVGVLREANRAAEGVHEEVRGRVGMLPAPLRAPLCCACWTFDGLRSMLTQPTTLEFAGAFIFGEAFGALTDVIGLCIVSPLLAALASPLRRHAFVLDRSLGFLMLVTGEKWADGSVDAYASITEAEADGAVGFKYRQLREGVVTFIVTMATCAAAAATLATPLPAHSRRCW